MLKTVIRLLAALAVTLVAAVVSPATLACACSCAEQDTDQAMANASAVFDGTVVSRIQPSTGYSSEPIGYTVEVERVYKGSVPATVVVFSAAYGASCGLELSGEVTVFAREERGAGLTTTLCSVPSTLDRTRLGAGYAPRRAPSESPAPDSPAPPLNSGPVLAAAIAGIVVLAGTAIWWVRRSR